VCRLRGQPEVAFFSKTDKSSPVIECQTLDKDIAQVRVLYAIAKVVGWLEGLVWPP
jgi:hypothetical protein